VESFRQRASLEVPANSCTARDAVTPGDQPLPRFIAKNLNLNGRIWKF
jgi:hypothetical protein